MSSDNEDNDSSVAAELDVIRREGHSIVNLNYEGLICIPKCMLEDAGFSQIVKLYMKRNMIKYLPNDMCNLRNLSELYLHSNDLQVLSSSVGDLVSLETLDVSCNNIEFLPESIIKLKQLKKLCLTNNNIKYLPKELGGLKCLEVLEVMRNLLKCIPEEIALCDKLKRLILDRNNICWLPRHLSKLKNLEELSVCGNQLVCLPQDLGFIPALKAVHVDNNPSLHSIPVTIVDNYLGLNRCGSINRLPLESDTVINIHLVEADKYIYLPEEILKIGNTADKNVPTLLELGLRITFLNYRKGLEPSDLPKQLYNLISHPTASCVHCSLPIFTMTFPVIFSGQSDQDSICKLGLCCSVKCLKLAILRVQLPVMYPDPSALFHANNNG